MGTLRDELVLTLKVREEAHIKNSEKKADASRLLIEKERFRLRMYLKDIRNKIVNQIKSGRVPKVLVKDYSKQREWDLADRRNAPYQAVWDEFFNYFKEENLKVTITHDHDGMGMESWLIISVIPLDVDPALV